MDIFNEYIIKRKRSGKDYLKIFGMIFGSVILYYIVMLLLSRLGSYGTVLIFPACPLIMSFVRSSETSCGV